MSKKPRFNFKKLPEALRALLDESVFSREGRVPWVQRFVHFWMLVWRSFNRNRCPLRASALSYTTLLALIPMFAVVVSITSSLLKGEGEERIDQFIQNLVDSLTPPAALSTNQAPFNLDELANAMPETNAGFAAAAETNALASASNSPAGSTNALASGPPPATTNALALASLAHDERTVAARREAARRIHDFIQSTRSAALGGVGTVLLLWIIVSLLSRIEDTMNDVWGVTRGRSWLARIEHYWFAIGLGPTLMLAGLALATGPKFAGVRHFVQSMPFIGDLIFKALPLVLLWLAFTLFYKIMPNTKVHWTAAAVGGFIGGGLWFLNNLFGFLYVSRVVTNFKIYGGLGLVPVFMAGLYVSWFILLFGAQVAYAWQNRAAYVQEKLVEHVNQRGREFVALRLMAAVGQRFQFGAPPATIPELSAELGVPSRLVQQVLHTLLSAKLVIEVGGGGAGYAPARPLEAINCHHVLLALRATAGQDVVMRDEPVRAEVYGEFARIQEAEERAASSVTLMALVNRVRSRSELPAPAEPSDAETGPALPGPVAESASESPADARPTFEPRQSEQDAPFPD